MNQFFSLVLFDIRVQVEEVFLFPEIKIALSVPPKTTKVSCRIAGDRKYFFFTKTLFLFHHSSNFVKTLHGTEQKEGNNRTTE